ncbi:gfo/Idh/MocA family oxidoreductase [Paenibacillus sp. LMG 31456]|uniref:Gfo/Idh/MocA family oxidoreductase n=1 Tax=Paenibacillus foliorum TaxID=2654974 RepID=A0A972K0N0_9BACL|nr:Gfo/Idh/MocA family oxidoreductase [Paenibacillus foliorum]NOU91867.1 gfo/Idh/MocA family oxidoreductase [Paenibacillus foliorum]
MKTLGTAIIGLGSISGIHLKAVVGLDSSELKAVVDVNESLAKQVAAEYGCDYYTDYKEMLKREDIQVVHLCTAHHLHAPMAVDVLNAGKHVLTEKPMAETKAAGQSMLQAAVQNPDVQLGVIFQNRYNAASQRIKKAVDSGEFGKLICMKGIVTWYRNSSYYETEWKGKWATEGGGVLINQSIHTLDLLHWFGGDIASVKGSFSNDSLEDVIEVEDTVHAYVEFENGARAIFYATNAYLKNSPVELEVVFEKGSLVQRGETLYLEQDGQLTVLTEPPVNNTGEKSYWGVSHELQIRDFYEHLLQDQHFWIDGPEGYKTFSLVMDIYESSRTGKKITYKDAQSAVR